MEESEEQEQESPPVIECAGGISITLTAKEPGE